MSNWRRYWDSFQERRAARKRSEDIDLRLKRQQKWEILKETREHRILLIGDSAAGRETFIKLMMTEQASTLHFGSYVCTQIFTAVEVLAQAMRHYHITYMSGNSKTCAKELVRVPPNERDRITQVQKTMIEQFWGDDGVQLCFTQRAAELWSGLKTVKYFLDNLDRVAQSSYYPTEEDMLQLYVISDGFREYLFTMNKDVFKMMNYTYKGNEQRKLIQKCFHDQEIVLFLCEIDKYNEVQGEDYGQNHVYERLADLKSLMWLSGLRSTPFVIFFTNTDQFTASIRESSLADYFPNYQGPQGDVDAGKLFIADMFSSVDHGRVHYNFTDAGDTQTLSRLFKNFRDIITYKHLKENNLL